MCLCVALKCVSVCVHVCVTFDGLLQVLQVKLVLTHQTFFKLSELLCLFLHLKRINQSGVSSARGVGAVKRVERQLTLTAFSAAVRGRIL